MMQYGAADIVNCLGDWVAKEGLSLARNGSVNVLGTPSSALLFGVLRPFPEKPSRVAARVEMHDGVAVLSGQCTCRDGRNCRHVAAVFWQGLGAEEIRRAGEALASGKLRATSVTSRP